MKRVVCVAGACVLLALVAHPFVASAQVPAAPPEYLKLVDTTIKPPFFHNTVDKSMFEDRSARNRRRFLVVNICKGSSPFAENKAEFDAWFLKYYYPMLTDPALLATDSQAENLAKARRDLMRDYFNNIKNDTAGLAVRDYLNKLTLGFLEKFVKLNLHPAVRYNAMLIIGDLDYRGPELFGAVKPADPMPEALEVLRDELVSPAQIDAVRVAAMIGLARHAELNRFRQAAKRIPDTTVTRISEPLLKIATEKKPPAGRSLEGHVWMRRQAMEILSSLAATAPLPGVSKLLNETVAAADAPLLLRLAAAEGLGKLSSPAADGKQPLETVHSIGRVAVDALQEELTQIEPLIKQIEEEQKSGRGPREEGPHFPEGGGILGGPPKEPAAGGTNPKTEVVLPANPRILATQRRLKHRLESVGRGLMGRDGDAGVNAAVTDGASRKLAKDLSDAINALLLECQKKAPAAAEPAYKDVAAYRKALADGRKKLEGLVPPPRKPATPAEPVGPEVASEGPTTEPAGPVAEK